MPLNRALPPDPKTVQAPDCSESLVADPAILAKLRWMELRLAGLGGAVIGFSGGVDSTLLAAVARKALGRDRVLACTAVSPSLARREYEEARELAALLDIEIVTFEGTEFENPAYLANGPDRCFHCKDDLFVHMARIAAARGYATLLYGANSDDASDYRPGHKAARLHGALAPLAEAGLTKAEIRVLSHAFGLPTAEKPSMPCLSSRIPYGSPVTAVKLSMVESGEALLRAIGFREYRLRHEGDTARLEIPLEQIGLLTRTRSRILVAALKEKGFKRVVVDLEGFRSGSLNEGLPEAARLPGA